MKWKGVNGNGVSLPLSQKTWTNKAGAITDTKTCFKLKTAPYIALALKLVAQLSISQCYRSSQNRSSRVNPNCSLSLWPLQAFPFRMQAVKDNDSSGARKQLVVLTGLKAYSWRTLSEKMVQNWISFLGSVERLDMFVQTHRSMEVPCCTTKRRWKSIARCALICPWDSAQDSSKFNYGFTSPLIRELYWAIT